MIGNVLLSHRHRLELHPGDAVRLRKRSREVSSPGPKQRARYSRTTTRGCTLAHRDRRASGARSQPDSVPSMGKALACASELVRPGTSPQSATGDSPSTSIRESPLWELSSSNVRSRTRSVWKPPARPYEVAGVPVWNAQEIVLVLWLGFPELAGRHDFCHDLSWPET
jgi:hypothetical protein